MTKDQLISLLQQSKLPGSATVRFECDAMVDGDMDLLVGDVTDVGEYDGTLVIEGDGVDPEERAALYKQGFRRTIFTDFTDLQEHPQYTKDQLRAMADE